MLWFSGKLGVYVPCTYVLYGPSDIMHNNGKVVALYTAELCI